MIANFYSYLFGQNQKANTDKVAEDKAPREKSLTGGYFVFCNDANGTLKRLIEAIGKHGNGGHSYEIVIDPDYEKEKESFFWDGDGSDRIESIIAIPKGDGKENPLLRMCLQTLKSINMQAEEAAREHEEFGEPPPSAEDKKHILNDIIHDSNMILRGAKFEDNAQRELDNIKAYCDNCLEWLQSDSPMHENYKDLTAEEALKHIREIAEEGLEKGITFLD